MKKRFLIGALVVVASIGIIALVMNVVRFGAGDEPKEEASSISAAEVAQELIAQKEKKASAEAMIPPAHTPVPVNPPILLDKPIYLDGDINFEQASSLKEVTISGIYGEKWSVWMQSTVLFYKTAYMSQEVSDRIQLLVFLRPTSDRNDNNYITLNFDIYPPKGDEKRWSATVNFDSRTQGKAWFSLAYDIFIQDWRKEDITNLAQQVLNIALAEYAD